MQNEIQYSQLEQLLIVFILFCFSFFFFLVSTKKIKEP